MNSLLVYKGIKFDSAEEVYVAMWLEELKAAGYVDQWTHQPMPFPMTAGLKIEYTKTTVLKTKTKKEKKEFILLRPSEYTADFLIIFTSKGEKLLCANLYAEHPPIDLPLFKNTRGCLLEVKPSFDQNNMERLFKLNQKFLWNKDQIFVNLVEPMDLFKKTFIPFEATPYFKYRKAPTGKNKGKKTTGDWKMDWNPQSLNDFIKTKTSL